MAISFINSASYSVTDGGSTNIEARIPTSISTGDLLIAAYGNVGNYRATNNVNPTMQNGWSLKDNVTATDNCYMGVFYKIATSGDVSNAGTVVTVATIPNNSGTTFRSTHSVAYRGVDTTTPFGNSTLNHVPSPGGTSTVSTGTSITNSGSSSNWYVCAFNAATGGGGGPGTWSSAVPGDRGETGVGTSGLVSNTGIFDSNTTVASGTITTKSGTISFTPSRLNAWIGVINVGGTEHSQNPSDTLTINDSGLTQSVVRTGGISDRARLSDSTTETLIVPTEYEETVSDVVTLSDSVSISEVHNYQSNQSDTETLSDSVSMVRTVVLAVSDTATLTDDPQNITHDYVGDAYDRETLSDSVSTELTSGGPITHNDSDTETLSDSATTQVGFSRPQSDTAELSDSTAITRTLVVSDVVTLADTTAVLAGKFSTHSDVVTLADTATSVSAFQRPQSDVEELSDSVSTVGSYVRSFSDTSTLSDSHTAGSNEPPEPDDLLTLSDSVSVTHIGPDSSGEIGNYTTTLVLGPASVYVADFGATEPQGLEILSEPSEAWQDLGGTLDGVELSITQEYEESEFAQLPDQPVRRLKKRGLTAKTVLAEPTLQNILYGLNGGTLDSGTGYESYTPNPDMDEATELDYRAVMLYGWAPGEGANGGHKRRVVIMRKCLSVDNVELAYKKEDQSGLAVTWAVHRVDDVTAPFLIIDEE